MAGGRASIYIKVNKSLEIVDDVYPSTRVGEVIQRLSNTTRRFKPQVLLEVWNGCSRLMNQTELILDSLNKWGDQARTITLVMMDRDTYINGSTLGLRGKKRCRGQRRRYLRWLKSPCRKRLAVRMTRKHRVLLKLESMSKLKRELLECKEEKRYLADLIRSSSANQLRNEESLLSRLSPSLKSRYAGLSNEVARVSQSNEELEKHKRELNQTLANRKQEIQSLQRAIEVKQKQTKTVKQETMRLASMRELKVQHDALQTNLKAKQKINQLQENKLQELTSKKTEIEKQIQDCVEEIQNIKIEV
ncbi:PREDICTED: cilia- and flagella-associated protein 58-like [Amphimedon queenslandica]|nr:PREDICTED: cilia- and flagella-associated protein 58-like [Amphimedon queenslandica]|eukprot:XP_003389307.1 PREDICTED: cilia- and flagella-associated protein 58-like [Amphimedon queenslandica]